MKKLLLLSLLCPFFAFAGQEVAVIGCRIMLDRDDYTIIDGKIYMNDECFESVFRSFKAWEMLDFHVIIYVKCESCGMAHPVDYACPNPNCRSRMH